MTVKSGGAWAGTFLTVDATGALATPSTGPAGVLYVDGTANAAEVTITGSNPYKFAVTLPALTAGQRVDMYITATIATIATAGVVASEQADTSILSDGVVVNSGTVTTLTNLPAIPANWLTGTGTDASAVTKIQAGLATPTNITAGTISTVTNLTNLPTMPTDWVTAAGIKDDAVTKIQSGLATPTSVLAATVDGTYTLEDVLRIMVSALAGKVSGGNTTTITFRDLSDTLNMIAATVDANGNRSGVTITLE